MAVTLEHPLVVCFSSEQHEDLSCSWSASQVVCFVMGVLIFDERRPTAPVGAHHRLWAYNTHRFCQCSVKRIFKAI